MRRVVPRDARRASPTDARVRPPRRRGRRGRRGRREGEKPPARREEERARARGERRAARASSTPPPRAREGADPRGGRGLGCAPGTGASDARRNARRDRRPRLVTAEERAPKTAREDARDAPELAPERARRCERASPRAPSAVKSWRRWSARRDGNSRLSAGRDHTGGSVLRDRDGPRAAAPAIRRLEFFSRSRTSRFARPRATSPALETFLLGTRDGRAAARRGVQEGGRSDRRRRLEAPRGSGRSFGEMIWDPPRHVYTERAAKTATSDGAVRAAQLADSARADDAVRPDVGLHRSHRTSPCSSSAEGRRSSRAPRRATPRAPPAAGRRREEGQARQGPRAAPRDEDPIVKARLAVGEVVEVAHVENSDKLYRCQVRVGRRRRARSSPACASSSPRRTSHMSTSAWLTILNLKVAKLAGAPRSDPRHGKLEVDGRVSVKLVGVRRRRPGRRRRHRGGHRRRAPR